MKEYGAQIVGFFPVILVSSFFLLSQLRQQKMLSPSLSLSLFSLTLWQVLAYTRHCHQQGGRRGVGVDPNHNTSKSLVFFPLFFHAYTTSNSETHISNYPPYNTPKMRVQLFKGNISFYSSPRLYLKLVVFHSYTVLRTSSPLITLQYNYNTIIAV